jgi:beta-galactosidase
MTKSLELDRFELGVCYYPEHWPENLWADDFRRMRDLGFSVIRVAEFAWTILEPEEGTFSFDLFDRVISLAHEHGLKVILGTPTATPPAWLTHKYPEVLNVTQTGVRYQHGMRRHYTYNAPVYRELSARIVRKLAEHYGQNPAVIGWQIDNELNCEVNVFYSAADQAAFRVWLKEKYGGLDELNHAWGTVFWSQTYTDWEQVSLTGPTPSNSPNPHQALDEKRFFLRQRGLVRLHPDQHLARVGARSVDHHERGLRSPGQPPADRGGARLHFVRFVPKLQHHHE